MLPITTAAFPPGANRNSDSPTGALDRQTGFRNELDRAGLHGTPIHFFSMNSSDSILDWLIDLPKPAALFCFNDQLSIQVQMMCLNHGIRVPTDIAILGVDNSPGYCRLARPSLSSIDVGFSRIGAHVLKQFAAFIRKERPAENRIFPAQMVHERGSTAGIAIDDPQLSNAVEFIETNFAKITSVEEIAQAAGISRRLLELRFTKHLHSTPYRYLVETRLIHAEKQLIYSTLRINEISDQCCFKQPNHFCRIFREHYGITPTDFRARRGALEFKTDTHQAEKHPN